ncbi:MAG TPA: VOC family protein [Microlunatus sp.]
MRLDHLSYAAGPDGARAAAGELGRLLGSAFVDGGFHPRFGTRNFTLPLAGGRYVEVVEVLDHPAADKAVFGQVVRARSAEGGGWLGWVVAIEDMAEVETRIGRQAIEGHRHLPDGTLLEWRQLGVRGLQSDPQLPFFVQWRSDAAIHPSVGGGRVDLLAVEIAGSQHRVEDWLGGSATHALADIPIEWVAPRGQPGLIAATFGTPNGVVRI